MIYKSQLQKIYKIIFGKLTQRLTRDIKCIATLRRMRKKRIQICCKKTFDISRKYAKRSNKLHNTTDIRLTCKPRAKEGMGRGGGGGCLVE